MPTSDRRLLASIHDVGPGFEHEVDQLADLLARRLGSPCFAMLVVPDHWGAHPLRGNQSFARRLRNWSDSGIEMFVHGWFHRDDCEHRGRASFKARHMTANEGEFLGLSAEVASRRMADGKALIEDIIGRPVTGFIAPAWLYGEGTLAALQENGFALAEDHMKVWSPRSGAVLARGPVVTWASRSRARTASSLAFAALARFALQRLETVRVAVHPGDVTKQEILTSIERTLGAFRRERRTARYCDLLS
ncbi:MAG: polysaccharide deacetylase family protein [Novosphingobium sp.]|nr:polysaccharide deacetylase family protein [Novosphingobium sp.]